jgi:hypothetical protein
MRTKNLLTPTEISRRLDIPRSLFLRAARAQRFKPDAVCGDKQLFREDRVPRLAESVREYVSQRQGETLNRIVAAIESARPERVQAFVDRRVNALHAMDQNLNGHAKSD